MTAWMWLMVVLVGAAVLGAFIFYGQEKSEEPESFRAKQRREKATREIYDRAEHGPT